jgi:minor extracellular serine protease Vpr
MMKRSVTLLVLLSLLAGLFAIPAFAGDEGPLEPLVPAPSAENGEMTDETPAYWFVELAGKPTADGGSQASLKKEQDAFRKEAKKAGLTYKERFAFTTLWNGLSIQAGASQFGKISSLAGVKAVYPVETIPMPATSPLADPELATALAMTGADIAQNELGYTGAGIKVAVMDTGIDYDHPDLGGCFGPGCRVATGWDFVGDSFNADPSSAGYNPVPVPDPLPDDCNGHGTHVAGIIGANGDVVGVAPEVTFGAYRVFGCEGSTTADIMIAAMEQALADKMHVLNMSIGSAFNTWAQYPTAAAADRLVSKGMVVVASIGNSGASGLYSAGAPGVGNNVIGVASFDNTHINALTFIVNPSGQQVAYLPLATTPDPPTSGTSAEVVYVGRGCVSTLGDTHLVDPGGKVALIVRGDCTFEEKYAGAFNAGAVGVVIHNNVTGLFAGGGVTARSIFGIGISLADGTHIRSRLTAGETVTLDWTDVRINAANPTGGLISSFSSYGLGAELALKPDIGAPGGLIRSTYPLEKGAYAIISGTSMASPHVAGGAALLLEARPKTAPLAVRDILQNSADPKNWWGNPGLGFLDNVHRQGAGMLDIDDAILSTTLVTPAKLSLGESEAGPATRSLKIENKGTAAVTYNLSHIPALSTGPNTFTVGFFTGFASATFSAPSVTVPAGGTAMVDVTITANPGLADKSMYGGYLVFTPQGGGQTYRVPYTGFKGDYQSIQVLNPTSVGFPLVARATACLRVVEGECILGNYILPPAGYVFDLTSIFEQPSFLVHFDHQVRRLQMEITDAASGSPVHPVFNKFVDLEFFPRNSTSTSFFAFNWDGTRIHSNMTSGKGPNELFKTVPDGDYLITIRALKALGDPDNPAHWETWTSPVVTIDRP